MSIKKIAKNTWQLLAASGTGFMDDRVTKLSGSLAYSTVFSIGPLMLVIISFCSLFLDRITVQDKVYHMLQQLLGRNTVSELQTVIHNAAVNSHSKVMAVVGTIALVIGATSIFSEIQDSVNGIWGIKPTPKKGWVKMLRNRFLSFSLIVGLGFLLLVSLVTTSVIDVLSQRLHDYFDGSAVVVFYIINQVMTIAVVWITFAVIFKVLPDANIRWKDVFAGALFTTVLFMAGKAGISLYIGNSRVGSTYGVMGSLLVLLVWIYYSSLILYFGAEFTKAYALKYGAEIKPSPYAVSVKHVEVETGKSSIREKETQIKPHQKLKIGNS